MALFPAFLRIIASRIKASVTASFSERFESGRGPEAMEHSLEQHHEMVRTSLERYQQRHEDLARLYVQARLLGVEFDENAAEVLLQRSQETFEQLRMRREAFVAERRVVERQHWRPQEVHIRKMDHLINDIHTQTDALHGPGQEIRKVIGAALQAKLEVLVEEVAPFVSQDSPYKEILAGMRRRRDQTLSVEDLAWIVREAEELKEHLLGLQREASVPTRDE